jgi:hypothetical protein
MSTEDHAELAARYGELIRGLQRLLDALRPEARSPKPEARSPKPVMFAPYSEPQGGHQFGWSSPAGLVR